MVTELIRDVNYFPGNCQKPIKLEILAAQVAVCVDSRTVIGYMRKKWQILPFTVSSCLSSGTDLLSHIGQHLPETILGFRHVLTHISA